MDFAINAAFTHSAGNKLVILAAEIKNNYKLMCHILSPFQKFSIKTC